VHTRRLFGSLSSPVLACCVKSFEPGIAFAPYYKLEKKE